MAHDNGIAVAIRLLIVTALLSLGSAGRAENFELQPAQASYRLVVNGIPLGLEARVDLKTVQERLWQLQFLIDSRLVYHREESLFRWQDCQATPSHYEYLSKGFGIRSGGTVAFDWDRNLAVNTDRENFALPEKAVDALAATMMARCHLARGASELDYDVADPSGLKNYRYRVIGREPLETPAGTFDTLRLERIYPEGGRRTELWVAVDLNYFMVRMDHAENPLMRGRIELTGHSGRTPSGTLASQD